MIARYFFVVCLLVALGLYLIVAMGKRSKITRVSCANCAKLVVLEDKSSTDIDKANYRCIVCAELVKIKEDMSSIFERLDRIEQRLNCRHSDFTGKQCNTNNNQPNTVNNNLGSICDRLTLLE